MFPAVTGMDTEQVFSYRQHCFLLLLQGSSPELRAEMVLF